MRYVSYNLKTAVACLVAFTLMGCTSSDENEVDGFFDTGVGEVGEVGGAPVSFSPSSYDFGAVALATGSEDADFVLTNESSVNLVNLSLSEPSVHFAVVADDCPTQLEPGATCTATVRFAPQASGYQGTALVVSYTANGVALDQSLGIGGTGAGPLTFTGIDSIDQVTTTSLRINWTHDANAANYFVFEMVGGVPNLIDTISAPTATYAITGLNPSTTYTYRVRAQDLLGDIETNTNNVAVTTADPPVLTDVADFIFPSRYVDQGSPVAIDVNNESGGGAGDDNFMAYTCVFDQVIDGAVAAGTNCTSLPGTVDTTFFPAQGAITWTPDATAYGPYEIRITGDLDGVTDDEIIVVDVRQLYSRTLLALDFDAQFADLAAPGTNPLASWSNLRDGVTTAALNNFDYNGTSGWFGDGTQETPHSLELDGVNDYIDLGNSLAANTRLYINAWINPADVSTANATILSNGGGTGNGFTVRQNASQAGSVELLLGSAPGGPTHDATITSDSPIGYWRMGQTGTVTNLGSIGSDVDATLSGTYADAASLVYGTGDSTDFDGSSAQMVIPNDPDINAGGTYLQRSIELWFEADALSGFQYLYEEGGGTNGLGIYLEDDTLYCQAWSQSSNWGGTGDPGGTKFQSQSGLATGTVYHVVMTFSQPADRLRCYLNSVSMGADVTGIGQLDSHTGGISVGFSGNSYNYAGADLTPSRFNGRIDEVAMFDYELTAGEVASHYNPGQPACKTGAVLSNDTWSLLSATYDGSTASVFVDGVLGCSLPAASGFDPASQNLTLGRDPSTGTNYWNGSVGHLVAHSDAPSGNPAVDVANFHSATEARYPKDYAEVVLASNPVAYWRLDEGGGVADNEGSLGAAVDGTYNGGTATDTTLVQSDGNATRFNGSSGYILFPDNASINTPGPFTERSIELWFNADDLTGTQILFEEGGSGNGFNIYTDGTNLYCQAWAANQGWGTGGDEKFQTAGIATGTPYHVVLTFSSTQDRLRCYLNGVSMGADVTGMGLMNGHSGDISVGYSTDGSYIHNGAFGAGGYFDGLIDEVSIYNTELTPADVAKHYLPR